MSLFDDLVSINNSLSSTLHGINSLLPFEVENLKNTPPVIKEAIGSARREGEESGYSTGYNEGRENAETIIVDISNEAIKKYTVPAEDWSELPPKIDEVYGVGIHDGKLSLLESSKYMRGEASGELVSLNDVSPVGHTVGVEVSSKNLFSAGTVTFYEFKELVKRTDAPLPAGTYTFSATITESTDTNGTESFFYYELVDGSASGHTLTRKTRTTRTFTVNSPIKYFSIYAGVNYAQSIGDSATYEDIQLELGTTATPYTPHIEDTADVKVMVLGKNLANKAELIQMPESASRKYLDLHLKAGKYYYSSNLHSASGVTFYTGIVHEGEVTNQNNVQQFSTFVSAQDEGAFTIAEGGAYRFLIYCSTAATCDTLNGAWDDVWIQIEQGNAKTDYEPYKAPVEYEQGEAIPSVYPSMTVTTDTDGATVNVEYLRDIDLYIDSLITGVALSGGE